MTIRILYQFATAKQNSDLGMAEVERRRDVLNRFAADDVTVEVATPQSGPLSIESDVDAALAVPAILDSIQKGEADGFDAAIISCFGDPGLEAARELVSIPVLASGLCAMHAATTLGQRFSIISPRDNVGRPREQARRYGLENFFASSRGIGLSVLELAGDREDCLTRMTDAARCAVDEDGADVLILGCMSMAFHDVAPKIQERVGVPVINPVPASLSMADYLVRNGLAHSKRAWPTPPKKMQAA